MFKKLGLFSLLLTNFSGPAFGQDTIPPQIVAFDFPNSSSGNKVGGMVPFRETATDDVGVAKVELYKDGVLTDTDTAPPWGANIDFNGDAVGTDHIIMAKVYDAADNASTSTLTVNKPAGDMRGAGATLAEEERE